MLIKFCLNRKLVVTKLLFIYIIFLFAFTGASFRFTDSGWTEPFRLIAPFVCLFILATRWNDYAKSAYFFSFLILYSLVVSVLFYGRIQLDIYPFYIYLYFLYILLKYVKLNNSNFNNSFFTFLDIITLLIIVLGFIQHFVGFKMPHIQVRQFGVINLFFWNENELSAAISCVAIIYFYRFLKGRKGDLIKVLAIFTIDYINDAKICMLGLVAGCAMIIASRIIDFAGSRLSVRIICYLFIGLFIVVASLFVDADNLTLSFRDYKMSLYKLIVSEIKAILTLNPIPGYGSLAERTNAIIYGIKELIRSCFFGIGLGNATNMMASHYGTVFWSAKSMHNIVFQFLTECGYIAIYVYYKVLKKGFLNIKNGLFEVGRLQLVFIMSFFMISSQSSQGVLSNYMVWTVLFFVLILDDSAQNIFKTNREHGGNTTSFC